MKEILDRSRSLMKGFCTVCSNCNGHACAGNVPGMGGIGSGQSFKNNFSALQDITFNMKVMHNITNPQIETYVLGIPLSMPVMAAPIGGVSFNMGGGISELEYVDAILQGCKESGIIGHTGDGVPEFIHQSGFQGISNINGYGIPFIKPWEGKEFYRKLDMAIETGAPAIGMDIDAIGLVTLRLMGRPVSPKSLSELQNIVKYVHEHGRKFILKGIMSPEDSIKAIETGVDAIVVSNHGGRVLDHTPGTADVLHSIVKVAKNRTQVFVDGGIRDGFDVLKMIALGADCVMIGRPLSIMALGKGKEGIVIYLKKIEEQLKQAMTLTGCKNLKSCHVDILNFKKH